MPIRLLVFRVGYMPAYDGAGPISGGGAHIEEHGEGGEMWNFRVEGGRCYGYVMTRHFAGVDLSRIAPDDQWSTNDELDDVDIVFIAKKPSGGRQVVVGWYRGATVFHKKYRKRRGKKRLGDWDRLDYLCQVDADRAVLLPEDLRTFEVPYAPVNGKGFPGQSNVWYPHSDSIKVANFVAKLRKYVASSQKGHSATKTPTQKKAGWSAAPDKDRVIQIELAAISATSAYFEKEGYKVISVEKDNRGWDLEVSKNGEYLLIEVKGHIGNVIQFELTPNEYAQLQINRKSYRVCVVRNALENSDVEVYMPAENNGAWSLVQHSGKGCIQLTEKIAARAFEDE
ncbi:protein NO VEIN domain-containing protein [Methylobacter sp. BlB1]|uniref:protein NO VEIN domain-containing protein n=1 Tax=Methylobacter sp. BlB1 TaxID=2785914 RepID=UPI0018956A68|nr:DUF3883 domain-containing protein [Methylobacter sp. BlB1]MBF6650212.1 DUF3883 domain-containing protein [Methylobacter sp. BlB1]